MELGTKEILVAAGTVVATIIGALKLPEWYRYLAEKRSIEAKANEEIARLNTKISNIKVGMMMLTTFIKNHFPDDPTVKEMFTEINKLISDEEELSVGK